MKRLCHPPGGRRAAVACSAAALLWLAATPPPTGDSGDLLVVGGTPGRPGGRLVASLRAEPKTFNPVLAVDNPSLTVIHRLHADLVHINRATQRTEPALAESWSRSADGRRYRLELRRGIRFSDGEPFDADDVVFTFRVHLDPAVGSPSRDLLVVGGEPLTVRKLGPYTVEVLLARPYAAGERLFDSIAILPEHRLGKAYREGRLAASWGLGTAPEEVAGLGPFRLARHLAGERLELERNPYYWKRDRRGTRLPYLAGLSFVFVANEEAQLARFRAGETDVIDGLSAEAFALLEAEKARRYQLADLGPGLVTHFLFFNLNDLAGRGLAEIERKQGWFRQLAFRRAVSRAIDRQAIVRLVYRGRATPLWGPESPANRQWVNRGLPQPGRSLAAARRELAAAGFRRDDDGALHGPAGEPVELSLVTNASNHERLAMATIVQDDLASLGMRLRVVPLEFRALLERLLDRFDYELCLLGLGGGDTDPNPALPVWTSGGSNHLWHLGEARPSTPWEAEIDTLMQRQMTELDPARRKALYDRVQSLVAENLPFIYLVSPDALVGARRDLGNFRPAVLEHPTLWNVDELFWQTAPP